jgi:tetratricopeptide (TPR) repeat protein
VVLQAACALADRCLAAEPRRALSALDAVRGLAEPKDFAARRAAMVRDGAAKRPEDPDLASELAVLLEAEKDLAGCEKLLAPLAAKLGSREGARILGGIYSAAGKFGPARDLLMPYCETRLKELHATSKELEKLQESASRAVVDQLRAGRAGDAWYRAYDKKDKAGQQAMVQEYVTKALEGDPRIGALESKLVAQARIVPVALDLGMVMLQRAQGLPADERKKELLAAEGVFLSIRGVAAQSDSYRVFYGQVLYWLGRAEEGRKLFDEYLASKGRSPESLGVVARLLREVGATSESWAMGEEAYGAEKDPARKQAAAGFMAACARDVDKEVYWLERSNAASKEIQAHLASSKGHLAERDGKDREAEEHYRRSAAIHAELPKSSAELNNAALVYLSLFRLSGKGDDYRKAAAMLEEALALSPDNSVLLGNAADVMSDRAAFDILEGRLDYRALGLSPDSGQLSYLYDDEAAREELVGRYTGSASFRKALELLKRQVLLAPRNRSGAAALLGALGWTRDEAALGELKSRLREVPLDQESYRRDALEALGGKKDAERRKALELLLARYAKAAAQPPAGKDDLTPAVAGMYLLGAEFNAFTLWNRPVDADEAVARAEKLCADRPCFASRWMVISALSCRMTRRLAAAHPGFAAALGKSGRALGGDCVLILAAEGDPGFRAAAAADPDMKRILALEQESCRRLPKEIGVWQWALRRQFAPESAKAIGDRILADRPLGLLVELNQQVSPMSAKADVDLYWLLQLRGEEAKARELLRAAAKDGVPLPEMPGK